MVKRKKLNTIRKTFNRAVTLAAAPLAITIGSVALAKIAKIPIRKARKLMAMNIRKRLKTGN